MQLPERGRAWREAARTFPFGIPVWDAWRQRRGGDTPFEEQKEEDRALKEGTEPSDLTGGCPFQGSSPEHLPEGWHSEQPGHKPPSGISVPKEVFGHRHGLDLPMGVWSDRGSGGFLTKPQGPEWRRPGSPAILQ